RGGGAADGSGGRRRAHVAAADRAGGDRGGAGGRGGRRRRADRELGGGIGRDDPRRAGHRGAVADRPGDPAAGDVLAAGPVGYGGGGGEDRRHAPARRGADAAVAARAPAGRGRRVHRVDRGGGDGGGAGGVRRGGRGADRGSPRGAGAAGREHRRQPGRGDPVRAADPAGSAAGADRAGQDEPGRVHPGRPHRRAARGADRVRRPRGQPDPDRVAADRRAAGPLLLLGRL